MEILQAASVRNGAFFYFLYKSLIKVCHNFSRPHSGQENFGSSNSPNGGTYFIVFDVFGHFFILFFTRRNKFVNNNRCETLQPLAERGERHFEFAETPTALKSVIFFWKILGNSRLRFYQIRPIFLPRFSFTNPANRRSEFPK